MENITGRVQGIYNISGRIVTDQSASGTVTLPTIISPDSYEGDYQIIPTEEQQVLRTKDLMAIDDFVINPIPRNYGLITWDGTTLTVS